MLSTFEPCFLSLHSYNLAPSAAAATLPVSMLGARPLAPVETGVVRVIYMTLFLPLFLPLLPLFLPLFLPYYPYFYPYFHPYYPW